MLFRSCPHNPIYYTVESKEIRETVAIRIEVVGLAADRDAKLRYRVRQAIVEAVNQNPKHLQELIERHIRHVHNDGDAAISPNEYEDLLNGIAKALDDYREQCADLAKENAALQRKLDVLQ